MNINTTDMCSSVPFNITKYFKIPIYSIVVAAGLPLNCLALWVLIFQIKRSITLSVYILNLVLANLLQTLTLPFWMYYSYHDHCWHLGKAMCVVAGLAFRTNFYAKNNFLCLIAMERFIGLVHPLKFHRLQTISGAAKVCTITWFLVVVLCSVGIWLQVKGPGLWQGQHCLDEVPLHYARFKVATTSLSFFAPFLLMGFFYFRVLFELRKVTSLEKKVKRQIYGFVSLIIASFFLLFVPYQVVSYYQYLSIVILGEKESGEFERSIFICFHTTLSLTTLGNILDPLLYILLLKDVRAELKDLICCKAHKTGISYSLKEQGLSPRCTSGQMLDQPRS
ncbi:G-protein coupled receptor 4-like [Tiliqua scincoides]|uniref:G-protein coupled receptor 4-like n=1 Tax=Tiliqua scincoides TaxID=71010 RepID=UPI0034623CAF